MNKISNLFIFSRLSGKLQKVDSYVAALNRRTSAFSTGLKKISDGLESIGTLSAMDLPGVLIQVALAVGCHSSKELPSAVTKNIQRAIYYYFALQRERDRDFSDEAAAEVPWTRPKYQPRYYVHIMFILCSYYCIYVNSVSFMFICFSHFIRSLIKMSSNSYSAWSTRSKGQARVIFGFSNSTCCCTWPTSSWNSVILTLPTRTGKFLHIILKKHQPTSLTLPQVGNVPRVRRQGHLPVHQ